MRILKFISQAIFISAASTVLIACGSPETAAPKKIAEQAHATLETPNAVFEVSEADIAAIDAMSTLELLETAAYESNKLADVLAKVDDEASARAAAAKMHTLGPMLNAIGNSLDNLDGNGMALSTSIIKPMQSFAEAQARIFNEAGRIAKNHPELQNIIAEGFDNIDGNFQ